MDPVRYERHDKETARYNRTKALGDHDYKERKQDTIQHDKETDRYGTNATGDHDYRVRIRRKEERKRNGKLERKE